MTKELLRSITAPRQCRSDKFYVLHYLPDPTSEKKVMVEAFYTLARAERMKRYYINKGYEKNQLTVDEFPVPV